MRNYFVSQGGPDAAAGAHATKKWWNNLWEKRKKKPEISEKEL